MEERVTLFSSGTIPGIPGTHGSGEYLIDRELRTIREALPEEGTEKPVQISTKRKSEKPVDPLPDIIS